MEGGARCSGCGCWSSPASSTAVYFYVTIFWRKELFGYTGEEGTQDVLYDGYKHREHQVLSPIQTLGYSSNGCHFKHLGKCLFPEHSETPSDNELQFWLCKLLLWSATKANLISLGQCCRRRVGEFASLFFPSHASFLASRSFSNEAGHCVSRKDAQTKYWACAYWTALWYH